jgi:hypothetical protein
MKSRALKIERTSVDNSKESGRRENLRERIAVESRIRSALQGRFPTPPL